MRRVAALPRLTLERTWLPVAPQSTVPLVVVTSQRSCVREYSTPRPLYGIAQHEFRLRSPEAWHLIPYLPVQLAAGSLWRPPANLFEEKRNICLYASISDATRPRWLHEAISIAALAAGDHPVNSSEI
jgi:hypothetical protein